MAEQQNGSSPACRGAGQVGDRWTVLLVEALLGGPQRFNDLLGQIPGDRRDVLAERLERLERDGLLIARPYSERPPRAAYQLTAEGTDLAGALRLLARWGAGHADLAEATRHTSCGTPLEVRWYCPTCDHLVDHEPRNAEVSYL
jgi:DNA-binding HxlR family transcriptional regulator